MIIEVLIIPTPKVFRSTHDIPLNKSILLIIVSRVSIEPDAMFIIPCMGALRKTIRSH